MAEQTQKNESAPDRRSNVEQLVMPGVTGYVTYDVRVECPHCGKNLHLNQFPYDDDNTDYSLPEDDLGLALFGTVNEPADWDQLEIEYICCGCKKKFTLSKIEV